MDHEEVPGKVQLLDDHQLVLDLPIRLLVLIMAAIPAGRTGHGQLAQPADLGMPGRSVERRKPRSDEPQLEGTVGGQGHRVVDRIGMRLQQARHLVAAAQVRSPDAGHPAVDRLDIGAGPDRGHCQRKPAAIRPGEMRSGRRDDG